MLEEKQRNYRAEAQRLINANPTIQSELGTSNSLLLQLGMFPQAHAGGPLASPSVLPLSLGMPQQTLALGMSGGLREAAEDQRVPVPPKRLLPPGWQSAVDPEDGDTYYYNLNTGESTWEHPGAKKQCVDSAAPPPPPPKRPRSQAQVALGAAPPQQAAAQSYLSQSQAAPLPLPPGPWPAVHQAVHAHPQAAPLAALSHHEPQVAAQAVQQVEPGQQLAHQLAAQQRVAAQPQAAAPPQQAVAQSYLSQSQAAPLPLPPGPWPAVHQAVHAHPQAAPLAALSHHEPQVAAQAVQQVEPGQQLAPPQPSGAVPAPASTLHPSHDTKDFPPEDWRLVLDSNDDPSYYENIKDPDWTAPFHPEADDDE